VRVLVDRLALRQMFLIFAYALPCQDKRGKIGNLPKIMLFRKTGSIGYKILSLNFKGLMVPKAY
jgi:hypothetical protein